MAASNQAPIHDRVVYATAAQGSLTTARGRSPRQGSYAVGLPVLIAGIAIVYAILAPLGDVTAWAKIPIAAVGTFVAYLGLDMVMKAWRGSNFPTGLRLAQLWLIVVVAAALLADILPLGEHENTAKTITIPGNRHPDLLSSHPFGTNNFSLDIFARCVYGARVSLLTAFLAVAISLCIGGTIGMMAGYFRGKFDLIVSIFTDSMLAFPALILLIAIITILERPEKMFEAIWKVGVALAIVGIPTMTRLARANTMVFAQREFVLAARSMGAKNSRIIFKEIAPNVALPMLSFAFILVANLIVAEGSLSFLGLGIKPPKPSWGNMVAEGQVSTVLKQRPYIPLIPGAIMFLTVFSFNRVGEWARSVWDPRESKV